MLFFETCIFVGAANKAGFFARLLRGSCEWPALKFVWSRYDDGRVNGLDLSISGHGMTMGGMTGLAIVDGMMVLVPLGLIGMNMKSCALFSHPQTDH